jgi:hypothetical protein
VLRELSVERVGLPRAGELLARLGGAGVDGDVRLVAFSR